MRFLGLIPARYASTRFPGKPLADIAGKSMIHRVYEQASSFLENVYVATDDDRIKKHVLDFGGKVIMTSADHRSGTDRCSEAAKTISDKERTGFDVIINIQGDEPFIQAEQLRLLCSCFNEKNTEIASLVKKINNEEDLVNPNIAKVILNNMQEAIYFSRSIIPFIRNVPQEKWLEKHTFLSISVYTHTVMKLSSNLQNYLLHHWKLPNHWNKYDGSRMVLKLKLLKQIQRISRLIHPRIWKKLLNICG